MNPRKVWLIARRDFLFNFRRRSYLFTAFLLPMMIAVVMVLIVGVLQGSFEDTGSFTHIGIVDKSGAIVGKTGAPLVAPPAPFEIVASEEKAAAALQDKTLEGYYVLPGTFLTGGTVDSYSRDTLPAGLESKLGDYLKQSLTASLGDPNLEARLSDPLKESATYRIGSTQKLGSGALFAAIFVPIIFAMLIYIGTNTTSQFLMSGVVEEKENRMMEILVTSTRPAEMMLGKLLGMGALGILQLLAWGLFGLAYGTLAGTINLGQTFADLQITPNFMLVLVMYFLLGYLLFGSLMAGLGATVSAEQEGRQISQIIGMLGVAPFILYSVYLTNPNSTVVMALSLIPFTAPVGMIMRMSMATVPPFQILLSMVILVLTVAVIIWLSARIFRLGMLSYGKRLSVREIVLAFREGKQTVVTAAVTEPVGARRKS